MCLGGCADQKTTHRSQFSSCALWVPGIQLRLGGKCPYLPAELTFVYSQAQVYKLFTTIVWKCPPKPWVGHVASNATALVHAGFARAPPARWIKANYKRAATSSATLLPLSALLSWDDAVRGPSWIPILDLRLVYLRSPRQ